MAHSPYYYIHEGYLVYTAGYKTRMTEDEFINVLHRIEHNETVTPEFLGLLLGRATAIKEKVRCKFCNQEIKEEEMAISNMDSPYYSKDMHQKCWKETEHGL